MGIYFEWGDTEAERAEGAPISLDLSPGTTAEEFRRFVAEAGGQCELASDLMYDDDTVPMIRVIDSGVVAICDEQGRMTCLSSQAEGLAT